MKISKFVLIPVIVLILINLTIGVYNYSENKKVGFVITGKLVNSYHGMKDAQEDFNKKYIDRQGEIDTLIAIYDNRVKDFKHKEESLSNDQKDIEKEKILILGEKITNYKKSLEEVATKENEKMIEGTLNQINSFIEAFAERNKYDYIIGVTDFGNVLYAKTKYDITDDLIDAINKEYDDN